MTKHQENKLSMYLSVQEVTNYFSDAWQRFEPFKTQFAEFEERIYKIKTIRPIQEGVITGVTKDKYHARRKVSRKALVTAERLYAFASIHGNNKLKDRIAIKPSELNTCRDTLVCDYVTIISNAASQYIAELADYGITQDDINELDLLHDEYAAIIENPRQAMTNRMKATAYLQSYFKEADIILKDRLDKLINYFKDTSPDLWHQYKSARKILDYGKRRKKEETVEEQNVVSEVV